MAKRRKSKSRRSATARPWLLPMLVVALVGILAALYVVFSGPESSTPTGGDEIAAQLRRMAGESGCSRLQADEPITRENGRFLRHWRFEFGKRQEADALCSRLETEAESWGDLRKMRASGRERCRFRLGLEGETFDLVLAVARPKTVTTEHRIRPTPMPQPTPRPELAPDARGRLAILLDDAGQQMDLVPAAAALPRPIAVAVLPFLPASAETAVALHRAGHEIWLHMPMEPVGYPAENPGPGAILASMPEDDVRRTLRTAINNVPFIVGINNHMGSKATADLRLMTWVMQEIRARNLFFIDSRTTAKTHALEAARAQGIPSNRRRVFLDNDHSMAAIGLQLEDAVYEAKKYGEAIAIGHLKKTTIALLAKEAPGLEARGVSLVAPGELMH